MGLSRRVLLLQPERATSGFRKRKERSSAAAAHCMDTGRTLEDHVDSILRHRGPVLASGRVSLPFLHKILRALASRVGTRTPRASILSLRPYDFKRTANLWRKGEWVNFPLAREAMHLLVQELLRRKKWIFTDLVRYVSQRTITRFPINRFGTTLAGMLHRVYGGSPWRAIEDLVRNDDRYLPFRGILRTDFRKCARWTRSMARTHVHLLIRVLERDRGWSFIETIQRVDKDLIESTPINQFGTTLQGMLSSRMYGQSYALAILDLVRHDDRYREYRDLRLYDFRNGRNLWTLKDGKKNYPLAFQAVGHRVRSLMESNGWSFGSFLDKIDFRLFCLTPMNRYGTTLWKVVKSVYGGRYSAAILDWFRRGKDPWVRALRRRYPGLEMRSRSSLRRIAWCVFAGSISDEGWRARSERPMKEIVAAVGETPVERPAKRKSW